MRTPQIGDRYKWPDNRVYEITQYDIDNDKWLLVKLNADWSAWIGKEFFNNWEKYRVPVRLAPPQPKEDAITVQQVEKTWDIGETIKQPTPAPVDVVNHPSHYKFANGVEVIDLTEQLNNNCGNVVKYAARAGRKDASKQLEDLRKAEFYIKREISRVERGD